MPRMLRQVDHAVAHQPASGEQVRGGHEPVRHVVAGDAPGRALDLALQLGVPPDVVGVDHHAHPLGLEALGQVERLRQRHHHRALGDHHRVQRLDAQPYAVLGGVGEERLDALEHLAPRRLQVAVGRRPADQHQHVRAQLGRLLHRRAIVGVALAPAGGVGGREEAAAAEARHAQAGRADALRRVRAAASGARARTTRSPRRRRRSTASSSERWSAVIWLKLSRPGSRLTPRPPPRPAGAACARRPAPGRPGRRRRRPAAAARPDGSACARSPARPPCGSGPGGR